MDVVNTLKDPLRDRGISCIVRIYKSKYDNIIANFIFLDGIDVRVNISEYGYWFIPDHVNGYTIFYDERFENNKIDPTVLLDSAIVYIDTDSNNFIRTIAINISKESDFTKYDFCNVEDRNKYFNTLFTDKKDIYFLDKRQKIPFEKWF